MIDEEETTVPQNKVQQRARAKRELEKLKRRKQEQMRKLRIALTVLTVVALGLVLFFAFNGKGKPAATSAANNPTASSVPSTNPSGYAGAPHKCAADGPGAKRICYSKYPSARPFDPSLSYTADIETNLGTMVVELDGKHAPKTVNNFIFLAYNQFYDGLTFHRVIPGFMIQGGDPEGDGKGGPGYQFANENTIPAFGQPGVLAMANAGANTNGSQFFITVAPATHLNGGYNVFGRIVSGLDIADKIAHVKRNAQDRPDSEVVIKRITVHTRKPAAGNASPSAKPSVKKKKA